VSTERAIHIRPATTADHDAVWAIFHTVIQGEDTFVFRADTPRSDLEKLWFAPYMRTYVCEVDGQVAGSYYIKPNQPDLGSHVANAGYMVGPDFRGLGLAQAMCAHSLTEARAWGYRAMQYNIVVSSNASAVHVWEKMGFEVVGRTPGAFKHRELGYVDGLIMFQQL
jgi:L-amino acid N-acyltransferase YncA